MTVGQVGQDAPGPGAYELRDRTLNTHAGARIRGRPASPRRKELRPGPGGLLKWDGLCMCMSLHMYVHVHALWVVWGVCLGTYILCRVTKPQALGDQRQCRGNAGTIANKTKQQ